MTNPVSLIKAMRGERGWSQHHLASLCNTSYQQISRLEKGVRPIKLEWAKRLGKAFKVDPLLFLPKDAILTEEERLWLEEFRSLTSEEQEAIRALTARFHSSRGQNGSNE